MSLAGCLDLTVVIATCRRASALEATLASIARSTMPVGRFEVVVADNADDPETRAVCEGYEDRLQVRYVLETARGKNAALNRAIEVVTGRLVLFTDDDVEAAPDWLSETWAGAERWPNHLLFGGRVLPGWPAPCPRYLAGSHYLGVCFAVLDPALVEGPASSFNPFGPNMAVRAEVFARGMRFNTAVGPSGGLYIMGSESEFTRRLAREGHEAVFLPGSAVRHQIRREQLSPRWLLSRGFRYGRKLAYERAPNADPRIARVPRWLYRDLAARAARAGVRLLFPRAPRTFDEAMNFSVALGMFFQFRHQQPSEG
ncbi:MAG: glycosyltransferase [Gemmatimonadota bacterium]